MNTSASLPLVIQSLRPVILKPSPLSVARVASAKASLPEPASDKQNAPIDLLNFGRYLRLMSSVPQRITALMTSVFCTSTSTPTDGSTRDSDSTASTEWKNVPPAPPKLSG